MRVKISVCLYFSCGRHRHFSLLVVFKNQLPKIMFSCLTQLFLAKSVWLQPDFLGQNGCLKKGRKFARVWSNRSQILILNLRYYTAQVSWTSEQQTSKSFRHKNLNNLGHEFDFLSHVSTWPKMTFTLHIYTIQTNITCRNL